LSRNRFNFIWQAWHLQWQQPENIRCREAIPNAACVWIFCAEI
jgi:hypothetical protein